MTDKQHKKIVILLTIDVLRPDHLNCYGYKKRTSPCISNFAKKGTIFTSAIANGPATASSFSALFTSILPFKKGGYSPLPPQKIVFPQILKENEITTFGIHNNPNLSSYFNYGKGFDTFIDGERYRGKIRNFNSSKSLSLKNVVVQKLRKIFNYKKLLTNLLKVIPGFNKLQVFLRKINPKLTELLLPITRASYNAPYILQKLMNNLTRNCNEKFIWAHFMDVHSPYNPPSSNLINVRGKDFNLRTRKILHDKVYSRFNSHLIREEDIRNLSDLYDAEINFVDENLCLFFKFLQQNIKQNCLVIITADHGEAFYEHKTFGHHGIVYDELLRIPLILVEIGNQNPRKYDGLVDLLDIAPTILDYYGIEIPEEFMGRTLLPLLRNNEISEKKYVISEVYKKNNHLKRDSRASYKLISIRMMNWKYIYDEESEKKMLFDLENDPGERTNVIDEFPKIRDNFETILNHHLNNIEEKDEHEKITNAVSNLKIPI
ncbi:MAG: sulfatase-like hydrolase/transferase [Candidatus Lokiarchaeota archaeon]|nr:sulfatase-like hydrolase/transferase [Candidatus Lokiarchaeota archaeon]MBD3199997.1 sulfatase-like hydrolase/transferase [Candidatus Lokiarchaeota archaeon]